MRNWRKDWRRCLLSSPPPAREMPRTTACILPDSAFLPASLTCLPFIAFPILVVGSGESCAARFVSRLGVGLQCGYNREEFEKAAEQLCEPEFNARCRRNCRQHAALFGDRIWRRGYGNLPARELPLTRASRFLILRSADDADDADLEIARDEAESVGQAACRPPLESMAGNPACNSAD